MQQATEHASKPRIQGLAQIYSDDVDSQKNADKVVAVTLFMVNKFPYMTRTQVFRGLVAPQQFQGWLEAGRF